jgi:hypothetical protein
MTDQGPNEGDEACIAIGWEAGQTTQGSNAISIGTSAGQTIQGEHAIAIGSYAGSTIQSDFSVAMGYQAGYLTQGTKSIAIGYQAGKQNQVAGAIAIGEEAAGDTSTTIGQGANAIAIGTLAGHQEQGNSAIAIGKEAGLQNQESDAIAIGFNAGHISQQSTSIAIGYLAGATSISTNAIAIGTSAGEQFLGPGSIAIGNQAAYEGPNGSNFIAIGTQAGYSGLRSDAIAIGYLSGQVSSSQGSIAIGRNSYVNANNGDSAGIAIGYNAMIDNTSGVPTVIGSAARMIDSNGGSSVVLGSGTIGGTNGEGFYIDQVREDDRQVEGIDQYIDGNTQVCWRNLIGSEICHSKLQITNVEPSLTTSTISGVSVVTGVSFNVQINGLSRSVSNSFNCKSFVIDHPKDENKYLVHGCLEGPESGVYYRGTAEVTDHHSVTVSLPDYVPGWATNFTVTTTAIYDGKVKMYATSIVDDHVGQFTVYGENGRFNWIAVGQRAAINVEPIKSETVAKGFGPYRWIE